MEKEDTYLAGLPGSFPVLDYSLDHHHHQQQHQQQQLMKPRIGETSISGHNCHQMVDYMIHSNSSNPSHQNISSAGFCGSTTASLDKLSFADVMQFADFGPKLALNQTRAPREERQGEGEEEDEEEETYFLKFPVLSDKIIQNDDDHHQPLMIPPAATAEENQGGEREGEDGAVVAGGTSVQLQFMGKEPQKAGQLGTGAAAEAKNKRKRGRSIKTTEEVESQRMTHIAVERNRRKQMNEHLRVLRSLMPGSYVQRGDQASIIGGAIEFVRELEQLLQCLESQKRRRLLGDNPSSIAALQSQQQQQQQPPHHPQPQFLAANDDDEMKLVEYEAAGLREETAESKSCLADIEVKLLGFDALIKILSRRRPGQLIKTIAALEDLQLIILHTNITTIEQTVLYSFNVKVANEASFSAEDIANSVQQIFSFINANSSI